MIIMSFHLLRIFFLLHSLLLVIAIASAFPDSWKHHKSPQQFTTKVRAAYWPGYSADKYPAASLNARLFTHLNYAFLQLNSTTNAVDAAADNAAQLRAFSRTLKSRNPAIKTLISIGGGGSDFHAFAAMASNISSRAIFIRSTISLARRNGFDGLDLDWEFPQSQQDMDNLGTLFAEWRAALESEARRTGSARLLLTAAVYYSATIRFVGGGTYPTKSINDNLDWVGLMAFDYHGSWEAVTGAHTALRDPNSEINTEAGVARWIAAGLQPSKAVLGLAMYGRSWVLKDASSKAGIGAPAVSGGPGDGTPVFSEIMAMVSAAAANATVTYDNVTAIAYAQIGSLWIGFDNQESIHNKVNFLKQKTMKGYFFWTASFDTSNWLLSRTAAVTLG